MRYLVGILVLVSGFLLVGCGKYHGAYGGKYYMQDARTVHPIVVPAGINSPVSEQYFTVPNTAVGPVSAKLSLLPPDPTFREYLHDYKQKEIQKHKRVRKS
jgi:uncharacterized lipoprotein